MRFWNDSSLLMLLAFALETTAFHILLLAIVSWDDSVLSAPVVIEELVPILVPNCFSVFQALVTLALDTRYAFPKDSSLKILTSGLLGEQYIGIEAGADEKNLAQGDRVTTTQSAVVLENLISQFIYGKAEEGTKTGGSKK